MALESKKDDNSSTEKLNTTNSKTSTPDLDSKSPAVSKQQSESSSTASKESGSKSKTVSRLSRAAPARKSGAFRFMTGDPKDTQSNSTGGESTTAHSAYQPSKVFLGKCWTEHQALLESIQKNYHDELKQLYQDELLTDLHILIGDQPLRPLHKCIIASRAYKFYSNLRVFKDFQPESEGQDIEPSDESDINNSRDSSAPEKSTDDLLKVKRLKRGCESLTVKLPVDLIRHDQALNLAYHSYLNTDLVDEEAKICKELHNWIKINKPKLVRSPQNYSPDHKSSFRTIQPDFEKLTLAEPAQTIMSSGFGSPRVTTRLQEVAGDSVDEVSNNLRDESFTGSSLPRTETFELISKHDQINDGSSAGKNLIEINDDDLRPKDANGSDAQDSDGSEPYAPTTRTGLKPKKFTTPVGLKSSNRNSRKSTEPRQRPTVAPAPVGTKQVTARDNGSTKQTATVKTTDQQASKSNLERQASSGSSSTVATQSSKRSSLSTSTTSQSIQRNVNTNMKTGASTTATPKAKATTVLTRAHPISMERAQPPATNLAKVTSKNFVAANKQRVAQVSSSMEKKPIAQTTEPSLDEDDLLTALVHEPAVSENIVAQLDKFALVSMSKLADALTKVFVDSILPDTIVLAKDGKQIEAHRSILAARSAYLNELITKQSLVVDTSTSSAIRQPLQLDLTDYNHSVVYFSLLHLYSGVVKVPEDIDVVELTKLSHQLHCTTLDQVCIHHLRMHYCHYFHKPCNICSLGVLKTLPLAWRYDYTDLYGKCLQWIGSHFTNIFCLKEFSELQPSDLIEECYSATLAQLIPENIIPKTIECQKLLKNLPRVRWTEPIICLVGRLLEDFCHYVADNYEKILKSESFMNLGKTCWECEILEENLLAAMNHLKPDSGCRTLIQLDHIECSNESYCNENRNVSDSFMNLVSKMRKYCERYLLKDAAAVVHCNSWRHMNSSLQKRIKDQAILSTDFDEPTKQLTPKPKLPSLARGPLYSSKRDTSKSPSSDGLRSPTGKSTPESRLKSPSTTYLPPPKNKPAAARHVKVLK